MCYQSRIRLSAPTTSRGKERARSDVLLEKRKERAIRKLTTSVVVVAVVIVVVVLFERRSIRDSNWPVVPQRASREATIARDTATNARRPSSVLQRPSNQIFYEGTRGTIFRNERIDQTREELRASINIAIVREGRVIVENEWMERDEFDGLNSRDHRRQRC